MGRVFMTGGGGTDTSAVTALPENVLNGKTFIDSEGDERSGTMANNSAVHQTLDGGASYTIPKGYHDGTGTVTAKSLKDQTPGNANQADIFTGKTAWVNGVKVTGSMPNQGTATYSLPINGTYTIPRGYHNGSGKVTQSIATMGAQTITPGAAQTVQCANKYMTGNITVSAAVAKWG